MNTILKLSILAILTVSTAGLAACTNTVHGAGQDIENAGENIQDTVE